MKTFTLASLGCMWLASLALPGSLSGSTPVGIDAISHLEQISLLRPDAWAYQCSSHARNGRNEDWKGILGTNGAEKIMMDVTGPGCIYRIWLTTNDGILSGNIRIYLDGSVVVNVPLATFFGGAHPWFPTPLVGNSQVSSGGYYCYVPIPFRTSCRVTHTNTADLNYYNITYHRYVTAHNVSTFDGSQNTATVVTQWGAAGTDPKPDIGTQTITGTLSVPPGGLGSLGYIVGSGIVQQIKLNVPAPTTALLANLRLQMAWDGLGVVVDAPLGAFFGSSLGPTDVRALPVGMVGNQLYCYFPMPFRSAASLEIKNTSGSNVEGIGYTLRYTPTEIPMNVARFAAAHKQSPSTTDGVDYNFLTTTGTGVLVGIVQAIKGRISGQGYLEGDERIYVDGGLTPALHGTGTEDFYNAGWYFEHGPFIKPVHGHPLHSVDASGLQRDNMYRFLIGDLIPYRNDLRAGIEHGAWNDEPGTMESVAFYYRNPRAAMYSTDAFDVGQAASETAHGYTRSVETWAATTTACYEGRGDGAYVTDDGRWLGNNGVSRFTVYANPPGAYVVLRRRLNYGVPRQRGEVRVDGTPVGIWYDAGSNADDGSRNVSDPAYRDSEFFLPPAVSRGKKSLQIEIRNLSTESEWTEYYYWASVVHDGSAASADFDYDGDVDQEDFAYLQQCMSGYTIPQTNPFCASAGLDADLDVDERDVAKFLNCFAGPGVMVDPACSE